MYFLLNHNVVLQKSPNPFNSSVFTTCTTCTTLIQPPFSSGWWYTYPSEKYEFVNWDDDIPIYYGKSQSIHVPNHQPDKYPIEIVDLPIKNGDLPHVPHSTLPSSKLT